MRCPPPKHRATDHVMLSNANEAYLMRGGETSAMRRDVEVLEPPAVLLRDQ